MEQLPFDTDTNRWDDMGNYYEGDILALPVRPVSDWPSYESPNLGTTEAPNGWSDTKEYYEAHLPFEGFRG